jgi:mono/diheme cytochrome c family protein
MFRTVASLAACMVLGCGVGVAPNLQSGGNPIAPEARPEERALLSVPALTGGTLIVTHDGLAVAADPERDLVWVANLATGRVQGWLTLNVGDEPGRLVEDSSGNVHVALRRGGALVTFDPRAEKLSVLHRRDVCGEPRGVTLDAQTSSVVVACTGGELVWAPADGSAVTTRLQVDTDLRDVIAQGDRLVVTTFRGAQVLSIDRAGVIGTRTTLPTGRNTLGTLAPSTAWKTVPLAGGKLAVVHHRAKVEAVELSASTMGPPTPGMGTEAPYGGDNGFNCPTSIVDSAITILGATAADTRQGQLSTGSLPIDIAVDSSGYQIGVVTASPGKVSILYAANVVDQPTFGQCTKVERELFSGNEPIAVAWWGNTLVAQTRAPAGLHGSDGRIIAFPVDARADRGFSLFHSQAGAPLACASCHAEGREDGRVWEFIPDGTRRTQSINGGLLRTAPFHWDGSLNDIGTLMNEVFVKRMGGSKPSADDVTALAGWLDKLPAAKGRTDLDAAQVARGKALFESPTTQCASCHSGDRFTNNTTVDVGTGGKLQVPSLTGLSVRGPWMHTGCAKTLLDRFTPSCGGGDLHGVTSQLSPAEIDDLLAYLKTL